MKTLLTVIVTLLAAAQAEAITITSVTVVATEHSSTHVTVLTDVQAVCQVRYGIAHATYIYQRSAGYSSYDNDLYIRGEYSIGGLTPNTTYYAVVACWDLSTPNTPTNNLVTSSEFTFTTSPEPPVHPVPPTEPYDWHPTAEPNTTGYTIVPLVRDPTTHKCVAGANVTAPAGGHWTGNITAGDTLETIEPIIWFKTILQLQQGVICEIPPHGGSNPFGAGINLSRKSPDRGPNDWILMETVQNSTGDFPPYGSRIDSTYQPKLAQLVTTAPNSTPSTGAFRKFYGQLFNCDACGAGGWWWRNLEFTDKDQGYPADIVDPGEWGPYISFVGACQFGGGGTVPFTGCSTDPAVTTTPHDFVIDRVYIPQLPWPNRHYSCWAPGGYQWAFIGTECNVDFAIQAVFPKQNPKVTGATLMLPFAVYYLNINDPPLGMKSQTGFHGTSTTGVAVGPPPYDITITTQAGLSWAAGGGELVTLLQTYPSTGWLKPDFMMSGTTTAYNTSTGAMSIHVTYTAGSSGGVLFNNWIVEQAAQVTFSGANLSTYTGSTLIWLDSTGVTIDSTTATGVSASCVPTTYCHVITETTPVRLTSVPVNALFWWSCSWSSSVCNQTGSTPDQTVPTVFFAWAPISLYMLPSTRGYYGNNTLLGGGQNVYADSEGNLEDVPFVKNLIGVPKTWIPNYSLWNGTNRTTRNLFELKSGQRWRFDGNIMDGGMSYENSGDVWYLAGSWGGVVGQGNTTSQGFIDLGMHFNIVRHIPSVIQCNGGASVQPPDPAPNTRFSMTNNLIMDISKYVYSALSGGNGLHSGALSTQGCQDLDFSYNTVAYQQGPGTALIETGAQGAGGGLVNEGFRFTHNYYLVYWGDVFDLVQSINGDWNYLSGIPITNAPPIPSFTGNTATWKVALDGTNSRSGASTVPEWGTGYNLLIPAWTDRSGTWADMADTGSFSAQAIQVNWSALDSTTKVIRGANTPTRMATAGWPVSTSLTSGVPLAYTPTPNSTYNGNVGADLPAIISHAGIVTGINIQPGPTYLTFNYVAPDARACVIDVSSDGGVNWARTTDAGGTRQRSTAVNLLTVNTLYTYRLTCYFTQLAAWEFTSDQITYGTISTLPSNTTRTVQITYSLPATATQAAVSYVPSVGSTVNQTCSASPCSITSVPTGVYTVSIQPQTSGAVSVGAANVQPGVVVR
jgi:hypothetical protein